MVPIEPQLFCSTNRIGVSDRYSCHRLPMSISISIPNLRRAAVEHAHTRVGVRCDRPVGSGVCSGAGATTTCFVVADLCVELILGVDEINMFEV
jgi:hypothetical protein